MSQIANLPLNNGTSAVVFTVTGAQAGTDTPASWKNGTSAINAVRINALERRVKGAPRSKTSIRIVMPIVRVVDGIEELVDTATVSLELTKPDILTTANRTVLRNYISNIVKDAMIVDMIDSDSPAY